MICALLIFLCFVKCLFAIQMRVEGGYKYQGVYMTNPGDELRITCDFSNDENIINLIETSEENLENSTIALVATSEENLENITNNLDDTSENINSQQLNLGVKNAELETIPRPYKEISQQSTSIHKQQVSVSWSTTAEAFNKKTQDELPEYEERVQEGVLELVLPNLTNEYAGYYQCKLTSQNGTDTTLEQHIFVNDTENLMANNKFFSAFTYVENREVYLPCRPSSPFVQVDMYSMKMADFEEVDNETIIEYNPEDGFRMKIIPEMVGLYNCTYRMNNVSNSQLLKLDVLAESRKVGKPVITAKREEDKRLDIIEDSIRVQEGDNMTLSCRATLEAVEKVKLSWVKEGDSIEAIELELNRTSSRSVFRDLVFQNISLDQSGTYRCKIRNHVGEMNHKDINVYVTEKRRELCYMYHVVIREPVEPVLQDNTSQAFHLLKNDSNKQSDLLVRSERDVNSQHTPVSSDECYSISGRRGDDVQFSLDIYKNTDFVLFSWLDPGGVERTCDNTRWKYVCQPEGKNMVITVKEIVPKDSGTYSFTCLAHKQNKPSSIDFCLQVEDEPRLRIELEDKKHNALRYSEPQIIECIFTAFPVPDLVIFTVCKGPDNVYCDTYPGDGIIQIDKLHYRSTHELWPKELGWTSFDIKCSASNVIGGEKLTRESKRFVIHAVDYEPPNLHLLGFCLLQTKESDCSYQVISNGSTIELYETKDLMLVCGNHGVYDDNHKWNGPSVGRTGTKVDMVQSHSSFINTLFIDDIQLEDSGLYSCNESKLNVKVKKVDPPTPVDWNMDNSSKAVNLSEEVVLKCGVTGDPVPTLIWRKEIYNSSAQNSVYLNPLELDSVVSNGSLLTILHFHEEHIGTYTCIRENLGGVLVGYTTLELDTPGSMVLMALVGSFSILLVMVMVLMSSVVYYFHKHKRTREKLTQAEISLFLLGDPSSINYNSSTFHDQVVLLPYDSGLEFPKERLKMGKQIGSGAFGRVLKAEALGIDPTEPTTTVAVKTLKPQSGKHHLQALMSEVKILSHLGKHPNILQLLGAVTENLPLGELYLIVEYCRFGNLQKFILNNRNCFIDQINPETGKFDSNYPPDIKERMNVSKGYNERLTYATLTFDDLPAASVPKRLTKENVEKHLEDNGDRNMDWCNMFLESTAGESANAPLLHNKLSVKDSMLSTDSDYPDRHTEASYVTTRGTAIDYCDVFPTYSKLLGRNENMSEDYSGQYGPLTTRHLLSWSFQIARGMEYLSSKKIVHGDLAARNILLNHAGLAKISDFGLSKNVYNNPNYQKTTDTPLPIKWLALETLNYRIFSVQSDAWSYGVVLWELFSLGRTPYPGVQQDQSFTHRLEEGLRMEKPEYATKELYKVMLDCWHEEPSMRPTFQELTEKIHEEITEGLVESYLRLGDLGGSEQNGEEDQEPADSKEPSVEQPPAAVSNPEYFKFEADSTQNLAK